MFNCTTNRYDALYARWLSKPGALLEQAGYTSGERLLDLCGGSGVVSQEALYWGRDIDDPEQNPNVTLLDLNPRVDWFCGLYDSEFHAVRGAAENVGSLFDENTFDLVVCRQALAYLDFRKTFPGVARVLRPGGRFVFNYFVHPLDGGVKPYSTHWYKVGNVQFAEAHLYLKGKVYHLQARLSHGPGIDITRFSYHDPEEMVKVLDDCGFNTVIFRKGRSLRFLCIKREDA